MVSIQQEHLIDDYVQVMFIVNHDIYRGNEKISWEF